MKGQRLVALQRRARAAARIVKAVGPRPVLLSRTVLFFVMRRRRAQRLDGLYREPLNPANVELRLPRIGLGGAEELPHGLLAAAKALRSEADHVVAHRIDLLGSGLVELGEKIDWHTDFKSGYRWPECFYRDLDVTRLDDSSDAKVPWELSRCHHLLTLARAARVFEDERYATELEAQLESWLDHNPVGIGINWVTPMEVAIRAVNLVWAVAILEEWRPLERNLRDRLITSLRWHARHIRANLEGTPYLRSNHYLSDIFGLLVLGSVLDGEPEAPRWLRFARREFEREVLKQVHADGTSFESSLGYHGLVLEILLIARYIVTSGGKSFSSSFDRRVRRMVEVSRATRHANGRIPLFGDQDSGRILPAGFARPPTHDNLLWLAAAAFEDRRPLTGAVDPEVAWIFGVDAWRRAGELAAPLPVKPAAFPDGGIYVLHCERTHVVIRCGDVGQNGFGGHSHNDMLSYELSVDGVPLIIDSGTYVYTSDVDARNAFRSTRAHNTLVVDGEEIHPFDPNRVFELRRFARPTIEVVCLDGQALEFIASHDGYRRLSPPVLHRRRFRLNTASGEAKIVDEIAGNGVHTSDSFLHFAQDVDLRYIAQARYEARCGSVSAALLLEGVESTDVTIARGLVSCAYGQRESAPILVASVRRGGPTALGWTILPPTMRCRRLASKT